MIRLRLQQPEDGLEEAPAAQSTQKKTGVEHINQHKYEAYTRTSLKCEVLRMY